jgi:hypothetical protein
MSKTHPRALSLLKRSVFRHQREDARMISKFKGKLVTGQNFVLEVTEIILAHPRILALAGPPRGSVYFLGNLQGKPPAASFRDRLRNFDGGVSRPRLELKTTFSQVSRLCFQSAICEVMTMEKSVDRWSGMVTFRDTAVHIGYGKADVSKLS